MQALVVDHKIDGDEQKNALLETVSDRYCRDILQNIMDKPKSAMEIAIETKIPPSTVYRKLITLNDNKLLDTTGLISDNGKKRFLYKSKIRAITSTFGRGYVEIEIIPNFS